MGERARREEHQDLLGLSNSTVQGGSGAETGNGRIRAPTGGESERAEL